MSLTDVQQSAYDQDIPALVQGRIKGKSIKNAWRLSTSLPSKGVHSKNIEGVDGDDTKSNYYCRTANDNCRLIVRETLNSELEVVDIDTVASLYYISGVLEYSLQNSAIYNSSINAEVTSIITDMRQKFDDSVGKVDDAKIRELVIDWLYSVHRVCVRGTGGVYFIPRPADEQMSQKVEQEIISMTRWISSAPISGMFSVIEVSASGATNIDALAESALDEIKVELESMGADMQKWVGNPKMNAGSRKYSAETVIGRIHQLQEKYHTLKSSLGDKLDVAESMIDIVRNRAMGLREESEFSILESRKKKDAETYGSLEDWKVEIDVGGSKPADDRKQSDTKKKSGITTKK